MYRTKEGNEQEEKIVNWSHFFLSQAQRDDFHSDQFDDGGEYGDEDEEGELGDMSMRGRGRGMPRGRARGRGRGRGTPPVCRHFVSKRGCLRGNTCHFLHPGVNGPPVWQWIIERLKTVALNSWGHTFLVDNYDRKQGIGVELFYLGMTWNVLIRLQVTLFLIRNNNVWSSPMVFNKE